MEKVMEIAIRIKGSEFVAGHTKDVCMIQFDGTATGPYFQGEVIGAGVDTQKIEKTKEMVLSARYMLEGVDADKNPCRIFIENNGSDFDNCKPTVYTNSPLLADWETSELKAKVIPCDGGVTIEVYML